MRLLSEERVVSMTEAIDRVTNIVVYNLLAFSLVAIFGGPTWAAVGFGFLAGVLGYRMP